MLRLLFVLTILLSPLTSFSSNAEEENFTNENIDKYVFIMDYPQIKRQMVTLRVIGNILKQYNYDPTKVEIAVVVFTPPAFGFLVKNYVPPTFEFLDVPKIREKAQSLAQYGVKFYACKNTMKKVGVTEKDLVDWAEPVPAGVVKVYELQKQGYKPIVIW